MVPAPQFLALPAQLLFIYITPSNIMLATHNDSIPEFRVGSPSLPITSPLLGRCQTKTLSQPNVRFRFSFTGDTPAQPVRPMLETLLN
jgi:hypothetical protein